MKRILIVGLVVAAHLLALTWFLRGCTPPAAGPPDTNESIDRNGAGQAETADSDDPAGQSQSDEQGDDGPRKRTYNYDPARFTQAEVNLPADLRAYQQMCQSGVLIDWRRGLIYWQKEAYKPTPIASMTKMMTVLLLMESLHDRPDLTLETSVDVTRSAAAIGGRQVYLDPREELTVDALLKCTMIFSANDTAYLIGEYLGGGDISAFVDRMNRRAQQLGMKTASFASPHGLPPARGAPDTASPLEIAHLAAWLLEYPEVVRWSSTRLSYIREESARFEPFQLVNTNGLVGQVKGVNGMKTGYTDKAGHCIAATCDRGGRVLIAVATGFERKETRDEFIRKLLDWGYER